ncbi:MAG: hypothetical protein QNJ46_03070 [Leptolyngbyaceae cyanobacterium MO_188.B28]|nr:hypothetical protein [Leptolyngbyaceae cyanobacterium MO_188.B28]
MLPSIELIELAAIQSIPRATPHRQKDVLNSGIISNGWGMPGDRGEELQGAIDDSQLQSPVLRVRPPICGHSIKTSLSTADWIAEMAQ